jgi:hypothetical protein
MFFSKKNILIPNVAEKKYSDFGGGKKINILTLVLSGKKILNETKNHNPPCKLNGRSLYEIKLSILLTMYILTACYIHIFDHTRLTCPLVADDLTWLPIRFLRPALFLFEDSVFIPSVSSPIYFVCDESFKEWHIKIK